MPTEPIVPRGYGPGAVPPGYQWTGQRWESPSQPVQLEAGPLPYGGFAQTWQDPTRGVVSYGYVKQPYEIIRDMLMNEYFANPSAMTAGRLSPWQQFQAGWLKEDPTKGLASQYGRDITKPANAPMVPPTPSTPNVPTTPSLPVPGRGTRGRPNTPYQPFQLPGYNAVTPGAATIAPFGAQASGGGIRTMGKPSFGLPSYYSQPWPYNRR